MRLLITNRDQEIWTHNRHFIPGHWSLTDWFYAIKYDLQLIWYHYFGKYKFVDTTKYMPIPKGYYFVLNEKQMKLIKELDPKTYMFTPTCIGDIVYVIDHDNNKTDITDYEIW